MTRPLSTTTIHFPELRLFARDAHKLRGFFGSYFRERSPLLHNHLYNEHGEERLRYSYPLVQYKIIHGTPMLLGLGEGGDALADVFLDVHEINIGGTIYPINHKNIERKEVECGLTETLHERLEMLHAIVRGNILSFFKGVGVWLDGRVMASARVESTAPLQFKDRTMIGFRATFTTNALLPDWIGLGKSVGRGFGVVASRR